MGKPSNRKTSEDIRGRVIEQYRLRYSDFGPAFAAEKLAEEAGVKISVSTLRRILIEENHRICAPRFQWLAHRWRGELRSLRGAQTPRL
jgi:type IV secretory pathway VirD2 relaxase